ncbi:MAG: transcription termination factor NusA [Firmicutes bacterium]|nr:transcription termination factor NusA [Bacillota bacterium]MDD4693607.1 transcription termination factor NusA [Bacillota bacterium]
MTSEIYRAIEEIAKEKGISQEKLMSVLQTSLITAYKNNYKAEGQSISVRFDSDMELHIYVQKTIVLEVENPEIEISLEEAREVNPAYDVGDVVEMEVTPADFKRKVATNAKQNVRNNLLAIERGLILEEFKNREGDLITGIVERISGSNVFINLGKTEALLLPKEQVATEVYRHGDRIKVYIAEVKETTQGPKIILSRTHPGLLLRLLELEVPEIHDGIVQVKAVAREAGNRSKVAVWSLDENVDPVGACVGGKGTRIRSVVDELYGERIDVIPWDKDPGLFVANALSPAKVIRVDTIEGEEKVARVIVADDQLSLAIGREGQNARLAAKLTGWKVDIKSVNQVGPEVLEQTAEEVGDTEDGQENS